jgi:hypothetical protein
VSADVVGRAEGVERTILVGVGRVIGRRERPFACGRIGSNTNIRMKRLYEIMGLFSFLLKSTNAKANLSSCNFGIADVLDRIIFANLDGET